MFVIIVKIVLLNICHNNIVVVFLTEIIMFFFKFFTLTRHHLISLVTKQVKYCTNICCTRVRLTLR